MRLSKWTTKGPGSYPSPEIGDVIEVDKTGRKQWRLVTVTRRCGSRIHFNLPDAHALADADCYVYVISYQSKWRYPSNQPGWTTYDEADPLEDIKIAKAEMVTRTGIDMLNLNQKVAVMTTDDETFVQHALPPCGRWFLPEPNITIYELAQSLAILFHAVNDEHLRFLLSQGESEIRRHWDLPPPYPVPVEDGD